jgi:hypothetical protein
MNSTVSTIIQVITSILIAVFTVWASVFIKTKEDFFFFAGVARSWFFKLLVIISFINAVYVCIREVISSEPVTRLAVLLIAFNVAYVFFLVSGYLIIRLLTNLSNIVELLKNVSLLATAATTRTSPQENTEDK